MTDNLHNEAPLNGEMETAIESPVVVIESHEDEAPVQASNSEMPVGKIVMKRAGAPTDIEFPINPPAIMGRFDPTVGPIDVDLGPFPEGSFVSRKHAKIVFEDGAWKIKDLGSSNGTWVLNDDFERVEESEIHDGQEFALGNARFVFHTF